MLRPMPIFFPIAMLMAGTGFPMAHSTLQARATELVPDMRGTAVALFAFSLFIGGGLGTWAVGATIDRWGYGLALPATSVALLLFTAVSWPALRVMRDE